MQAPHALRPIPPAASHLAPLRAVGRLFAPRFISLADLIPEQDLERSVDGWRSCGPAPRFRISHSFAPGWVRIRLKMTAATAGWLELYVDGGDASRLMRVEVQGGVDQNCFVHINDPARGLWLCPPAGPGEFRLEKLRIEPLSGLRALGHAVFAKIKLARKYWQTGRILRRGLAMLAHGDFGGLARKSFRGLNGPDLESREPYDENQVYEAWRASRRLTDEHRERLRAEAYVLSKPPRFSVLLSLIEATAPALHRSLESVLQQTYPMWEVCVACSPTVGAGVRSALLERARREPRIRIAETLDLTGERLNAALRLASGDYVTLLGEGDELAPQALSEFARAVAHDRKLDMMYADEDAVASDGRHVEPFFKPGWSPETLLAWMYTGRPGLYRTALVRRLSGFRADCEPAQEYDLVLRIAAESPRVARVADVLYHRHARADASVHAEEAALRTHLERTDRQGAVEPGATVGLHRVRFVVRGQPLVSIIIPSACKPVRIRDEKTYYLLKCLESIRKSTWNRYEIIALHGPILPPVIACQLDQLHAIRAEYEIPFNWARAMNQGAALARGEHLLFLNDDVEVITPDWLERMLEFSQQPAIGAVGATLFFPGGRLQHAGVGGRPRWNWRRCVGAQRRDGHAGGARLDRRAGTRHVHGSRACPRDDVLVAAHRGNDSVADLTLALLRSYEFSGECNRWGDRERSGRRLHPRGGGSTGAARRPSAVGGHHVDRAHLFSRVQSCGAHGADPFGSHAPRRNGRSGVRHRVGAGSITTRRTCGRDGPVRRRRRPRDRRDHALCGGVDQPPLAVDAHGRVGAEGASGL